MWAQLAEYFISVCSCNKNKIVTLKVVILYNRLKSGSNNPTGAIAFYCVTDFDVDATHEKKEEMIAARQEEEFQARYKEWRENTHTEVHQEVWDALDFDMESVG